MKYGAFHKSLFIFQLLLQKWGIGLNNRTEVEKRAVKGKLQSATYAQTQSYLRPLMKKLRQNNLPPDIQESLTEIIGHLLDRNYIAVNIICLLTFVRNFKFLRFFSEIWIFRNLRFLNLRFRNLIFFCVWWNLRWIFRNP